jgi:hypothetical protein
MSIAFIRTTFVEVNIKMRQDILERIEAIAKDNNVLVEDVVNTFCEMGNQKYEDQSEQPEAPVNKKPIINKSKEVENGKWTRKYDGCLDCGRSDRRHAGKGLCINCYNKNKGSNKTNREGSGRTLYDTYCQFSGCPAKDRMHSKSFMEEYNGMLFCNIECLENFKAQNET